MRKNLGFIVAVTGSTLAALSLTGSTQLPANFSLQSNPSSVAAVAAEVARAKSLYASGQFLAAGNAFRAAATHAEKTGATELAAKSLSNAGSAALARLNYRDALMDFARARQIADSARLYPVLANISNNLASLYFLMGNNDLAIQVATTALAQPMGSSAKTLKPRLEYQLASALAATGRFNEALPIYRRSISAIEDEGDIEAVAKALTTLGIRALAAQRPDEAEAALTEALRLVRTHSFASAPNVLRVLARLKQTQGDFRSAAALFDRAIESPQGSSARWFLYADRGEFRIDRGDLSGALTDFRKARRLAALMRLDMVPADQNRIVADSGLSRIDEGLVEAGNRLARQISSRELLEETFDAAENDRLWSLRTLLPAPNDWRTRLPELYWDRLAQYQKLQLTLLANPAAPAGREASALRRELQEIEAAAGDQVAQSNGAQRSPLTTLQEGLDSNTVFLSFHLSERGTWLWAADRQHVDVWPLPPLSEIQAAVAAFTRAVQSDSPQADALGLRLYRSLFGSVKASYLARKRWLLELDAPLFDLPFAALPVADAAEGPVYLVERATLQVIPSAMMIERHREPGNGGMLAIGDAIYNSADTRYRGGPTTSRTVSLPRLPATAREISACALAWGQSGTRILAGADAGLAQVAEALRANPSIIHFATHVVTGPGDFSSGLIALSLDRTGALGLLGPKDILARPVTAELVVLNGCHSAQGQTIPGAGLMGLTRAWIGAGAGAVLATRWDIADDASQTFMSDFYSELRAHRDKGPAWALQQAQLALLKHRNKPGSLNLLGAYFLLGRAL